MSYIPQLYDFLGRLSANNNREWFHANKAEYTYLRNLWEDDLARLIAAMSQWQPEIGRMTPKIAAYRIYRDTRFSPDKRPLKSYFSASFSKYGKQSHMPGYYLQMGVDADSGLYGGIWCPDSTMLRKLRHAIVDNIEEFEEILSAPQLIEHFPDWCGASLKTVPNGYDRNHPQAEYLRLKEYGRFEPCDMKFFCDSDWPEIVADRFRAIAPLVDFLSYSIEEDV